MMQRIPWMLLLLLLLLCIAAVHAWTNNHHDGHNPSASSSSSSAALPTWSTTTINERTTDSQVRIGQQQENTLRNCIRQAACNALIYQGRWKFCVAIDQDNKSLLKCLTHDVACAGNFWTPRTYLVHFGGDRHPQHMDALLQHHWQKTTILSLNRKTNGSSSPESYATKALRSIPTRILPRLSNSGHAATDIPVFDLIVTSSHRLEQSFSNDKEQQQNVIGKKRKKRRKQKKDLPWVVQTSSSSSSSISLSLPVLQAAKQLVVVDESADQYQHPSHIQKELLPRAIWIPSPTITPQRPEDVPWGTTWT